jgi:hypothetical protein
VRENEIAREIVDAAYKIHTGLGAGLLESVYEAVMAYELQKRGLKMVLLASSTTFNLLAFFLCALASLREIKPK